METKNSHLHVNIIVTNRHIAMGNQVQATRSAADVTVGMGMMENTLPLVKDAKLATNGTILKCVVLTNIPNQHAKSYMFMMCAMKNLMKRFI